MTWIIKENTIRNSEGTIYKLNPYEFWYLAPERTTYSPGERHVKPTDFSILMHNAFLGEGLVVSMSVLMEGIAMKTDKIGAAAEAEMLLEKIRKKEFPHLPSRLRCHFLNGDKTTAEYRMHSMFRNQRRLVRCYLVGDATVHFADVELYERLEGRPDDENLARRYWQTFTPTSKTEASRLEILANAALYFPDWSEFPNLNENVLLEWQIHYNPS